MSTIKVRSIDTLNAEFSVPGDKSLSHRVAILGGLARGVTTVKNFLPSADCVNTLNAMQDLGLKVGVLSEMVGYGPVNMRLTGTDSQLKAPARPVDCGNSGTGMRLLAGLVSGCNFSTELFGDESLSSRPMGRIITPLTQMGAMIQSLGEKEGCAPLKIQGGDLRPISYDMPVASAQVKSAILLAGMGTEGITEVIQPATTRDHTERLMRAFDLRVDTDGNKISLRGQQVPQAIDFHVPGDISSAAFWLVAAAALPGSKLTIQDVGLNPTRSAIIDVLVRMGAKVHDHVQSGQDSEPIGSIQVEGALLKGTDILKDEVPNLIDEVPIIAVAGALAGGVTTIRNAKELRVKETDRIATVAENLRLMGVEVEEFEDGMEIQGGAELKGAKLKSYGDHRIAMAFAIAGLFASGETVIEDTDCIDTSYPGFDHVLQQIRRGRNVPADFAPEMIEYS